jgi:hypothetical protein
MNLHKPSQHRDLGILNKVNRFYILENSRILYVSNDKGLESQG